MKKTMAVVMLAALAVTLTVALPAAEKEQTRSVSGQVTGQQDTPLPDAVVYLKNTKTLAVHTFISDKDGQYRFNGLSPNVDYELFAQYKEKKSDTKTLSSFDSRAKPTIHLHIDVAR